MATQLTQADLLALFARILPSSYLDAIKNVGPGYELLQAWAKLWERVSQAVKFNEDGMFILSATGAALSSVNVLFSRPTAAAGAVTVKAGTIVTTSQGDRQFVVMQDAVFGAPDLGPVTVPATAVFSGSAWNVPGQRTTARGETLVGEVDTILLPILDPAYGDATFVVAQVANASGGTCAFLDQLGDDRGLPRNAGEADDRYRYRMRLLPDTVSPGAIDRTAQLILGALGIAYTIIETWQVDYQTCWDGPVASVGDYDTNLFCYDDPRPSPPFRGRWLDESDHRGAFIVVVPLLDTFSDVGMAYDDTALTVAQHASAHGRRAHTAFDVPTSASTALILQGGYDGFDLPKQAVYKGLIDVFQQIKAGGVDASVEIDRDYPVDSLGNPILTY